MERLLQSRPFNQPVLEKYSGKRFSAVAFGQSKHSAWMLSSVSAIVSRQAALGNRLYVVFTTIDDRQLGVWVDANHSVLSRLCVGQPMMLWCDRNGHLHLPHPWLTRLIQFTTSKFSKSL